MPEQIKLDRSIYGYDKLIKEGNNFVALQGEDKPKLYKGMKVVLLGDSRGYVSSSFNPGEEITIIRFREPFKGGNSGHIILVSDGIKEGGLNLPIFRSMTFNHALQINN